MKYDETSERQPELILSPGDVSRMAKSDRASTQFANMEFAEIAALLEKLSVLERRAETKLRAWQHDRESFSNMSAEIEHDMRQARARLHDILLSKHSFPQGPQLMLMPSDVYEQMYSYDALQFRNSEMQNLAHHIGMIASFEQELESYFTRTDGLEQPERLAMIRDTQKRLKDCKDHLTKILTGYYNRNKSGGRGLMQ